MINGLLWKRLTGLIYSVPDEVNALATKVVIFKARLLCRKSLICSHHAYCVRKGLGCLLQALLNKDLSLPGDLMTLGIWLVPLVSWLQGTVGPVWPYQGSSVLHTPQPRTPCEPPSAISPWHSGAAAGLVSSSSWPWPARPWAPPSQANTWTHVPAWPQSNPIPREVPDARAGAALLLPSCPAPGWGVGMTHGCQDQPWLIQGETWTLLLPELLLNEHCHVFFLAGRILGCYRSRSSRVVIESWDLWLREPGTLRILDGFKSMYGNLIYC